MKWPPEVEVVAAIFRGAGAEARLEQLPAGESEPPGVAVRALAYDCEGRRVVTLVPAERELDPRKVVGIAGCAYPRPVSPPAFPFTQAKVFMERLLLGEHTVWVHAGSPEFVVGVAPSQLARLVDAQTADLVADA